MAPAICTWLVARAGQESWPAALYVMAMAAVSLVAIAYLPETFRRDLRSPAPVAEAVRDDAELVGR